MSPKKGSVYSGYLWFHRASPAALPGEGKQSDLVRWKAPAKVVLSKLKLCKAIAPIVEVLPQICWQFWNAGDVACHSL